MALAEKRNNIMSFGNRMLDYMSIAYPAAPIPNPPASGLKDSWDSLETRLAYYLTRGWTFT